MGRQYTISSGPEFDLGGGRPDDQEFVLTVEHDEEFPPEQWRAIAVCAVNHAKENGKKKYSVSPRFCIDTWAMVDYLKALGFRLCGNNQLVR